MYEMCVEPRDDKCISHVLGWNEKQLKAIKVPRRYAFLSVNKSSYTRISYLREANRSLHIQTQASLASCVEFMSIDWYLLNWLFI